MDFDRAAARQGGVVTHEQAIELGVSESEIRSNLRNRRWRRIHRGTYLTFGGPIPRASLIWAAVLAVGDDAAASHSTAGELWGICAPEVGPIHIAVPLAHGRSRTFSGVTVHRMTRWESAVHPTVVPPMTRVDETVLDMIQVARCEDDVISVLSQACGRGLTTPSRLRDTAYDRPRLRWRLVVYDALRDIQDGVRSPLESRYRRHVELAHGLPTGFRQAPARDLDGGRIYRDVRYAEFRTIVELDGRAVHPIEDRSRHLRRDNSAATAGEVVLHFGWSDVAERPCETAAAVALAVRAGGWTGRLKRCKQGCRVSDRMR